MKSKGIICKESESKFSMLGPTVEDLKGRRVFMFTTTQRLAAEKSSSRPENTERVIPAYFTGISSLLSSPRLGVRNNQHKARSTFSIVIIIRTNNAEIK